MKKKLKSNPQDTITNIIKRFLTNNKPSYILCILSGLILGFSYIPFPGYGSFVAFIFLWKHLKDSKSTSSAFWGTFLTYFIIHLIGFYWIGHTVNEFGQMPWAVSILCLFAYCGFSALSFATTGWIWKKYFKSLLAIPVLFSLCHILVPQLFPWNYGYAWFLLGYDFYQIAEWIGFEGLSTITLFTNYFILINVLPYFEDGRWFKLPKSIKHPVLNFTIITSVTLITPFIANELIIKKSHNSHIKNRVFSITQANIGNEAKHYQKYKKEYGKVITNKFTELVNKELKNTGITPDFIIWPETAFPFIVRRNDQAKQTPLLMLAKKHDTAIITGTYSRNPNTGRMTNSAIFVDEIKSTFVDKSILLMFGEALPGEKLFPWLRKLLPTVGAYEAGPGPKVVTYKNVNFGVQICYESLYPSFSRGLAKQDPEVILNLTNDSWYGKTSEPHQHLYATAARAVETRTPIVRSTNTGYSAFINMWGEITQKTDLYQEQSLTEDISLKNKDSKTFYVKYGYWLYWLFLIFMLGFSYFIGMKEQAK